MLILGTSLAAVERPGERDRRRCARPSEKNADERERLASGAAQLLMAVALVGPFGV